MPGTSAKRFCYEYPRPAVTVDMVVLAHSARGGGAILLIRRAKPPFQGRWALPGGFVDIDESLEDAARRELEEETGIRVGELMQVGAFGDPKRDPRGRVIAVAFLAVVRKEQVSPRGGDDAREAAWFSLKSLPSLAFDHEQIVQCALRKLRGDSRREANPPRSRRPASSRASRRRAGPRGSGRGRSTSRVVPGPL